MSIAYHEPVTWQEALALMTEHGDDATVLAGGTAFMLLLRQGLIRPGHVVALRADLAERQYADGPVRMLVEEVTQRGAGVLLLCDPEPVRPNSPGYGAFLETVVERLADEAGYGYGV